jgi:LytS/YehU family sensor histidine kinase
MLRTQVDPHFLFNSLNSVSALTSIDPARARAMVVQLADFVRHTLGVQAGRKVTLDSELQLVRQFVAIEQVRFGDRLAFDADVADDARAARLPPMLLQPLVENAVKHGVAQMLGPGRVRLAATRAGAALRIVVENDVDADARTGTGGIGMDNVRQRLAVTYGHEASVHAGRVADANLFRVELALPFDTRED